MRAKVKGRPVSHATFSSIDPKMKKPWEVRDRSAHGFAGSFSWLRQRTSTPGRRPKIKAEPEEKVHKVGETEGHTTRSRKKRITS